MDKIIKRFPDDNDKYYIENDRDTNTFKFQEDPYQREKDDIYRPIFTVEKKLARSIRRKKRTLKNSKLCKRESTKFW